MENKNVQDFLNSLTEEQRAAVLACKTEEELEQVIDEYDIDLPDEMLADVAGGKARLLPALLAGIIMMSGTAFTTAPLQANAMTAIQEMDYDTAVMAESGIITASELEKGVTFNDSDDILQVITSEHIKPPKGSTIIHTKLRNLSTGAIFEKDYNPNIKFVRVYVERRSLIYSFREGDLCYFLDTDTYEFIEIEYNKLFDNNNLCYFKTDTEYNNFFYKGKAISAELPEIIELKVIQTDIDIGNKTKTASLETGSKIKVPLSVESGNMIRINTLTGEFVECV